jgi:elongator complex protein 3
MDYFTQACQEILEEMEEHDISDQHELNRIKLRILQKYKAEGKVKQIPKNTDILFVADKSKRAKYKELLSLKPVRTISGVAPIALMSDSYPCPHTLKGIGPCTYCPGGPGSPFGDTPQSYTGKEPSTRRSMRNNYDPYLVVFNRIEHYIAMGKIPDKAEIIIQGGTFTFFPKHYQEYFVKYAFKAMNDFSRIFFRGDEIDLEKFKKFFELPRLLEMEDSRIKKVQNKLLFIKNLDLSQDLEKVNIMIKNNDFSDGIDSKIEVDESNANLRAMKTIQLKVKQNNNEDLSLKQMQKENETSLIRCVGLTIETKSDFGKLYHGNLMLELGCTRVEIGIQSIYDKVLEITHRGNSVKDNIESLQILKDLGFKINAHYMPGLPETTREMDLEGLRQLFENPDYKPDMLKIYPCMVLEGTKLYEDFKQGKFQPLTTKQAAEMIAEAKKIVPKWCRIMRVQRDIPTYVTSAGVDRTNLRQYVEKICKEKGIRCRCIRCREAGFHKNVKFEDIRINVDEYEASKGKEFFIEAAADNVLVGFCRLRFPSQFLRPEITENSALIRELHVFSAAAQIGKRSDESFQHRGLGKSLLKKAEELAKSNGKDKMVIISGIGARPYFRKFGYVLEGPYMVKSL